MTEHAQSIIDDARNWREVVRTAAEWGIDPRTITPELVITAMREHYRFGVDYYSPEYAGFRCYEDVEYSRR